VPFYIFSEMVECRSLGRMQEQSGSLNLQLAAP
jgi:hypothetical protein